MHRFAGVLQSLCSLSYVARMTLGEHTDYGRLARSAAPTGAGCRHRSCRAGLVGARVAQGPYDAGVIVPAWWRRE